MREPVSDNPALARAVAAAFRCAPEPLALDALVLRLAEGLLEAAAPARRVVPPRRLDHAALARARAFLDSRRAIVRSAELEAITGLSRYELARQFRAAYGTSPYRYSLMRRLDFARTGCATGMPLAELALAAGFADQAHFTRMFRSAFGVTPGRYARLRAAETSGRGILDLKWRAEGPARPAGAFAPVSLVVARENEIHPDPGAATLARRREPGRLLPSRPSYR